MRYRCVCLVVIVMASACSFIPDADTRQSVSVLKDEFHQTRHPTWVIDDRTNMQPTVVWTGGGATISVVYRSSAPFESIREYYHRQLVSRGWSLLGETAVRDWGRDFGGRLVRYCKSGMQAHLQFAGAIAAEYRWDFAFGMSWRAEGHLNPCRSSAPDPR